MIAGRDRRLYAIGGGAGCGCCTDGARVTISNRVQVADLGSDRVAWADRAALPSGLEAFVEHVVPVLRAKGLFREDYDGSTLREHYGLAVPTNQFQTDDRVVVGG